MATALAACLFVFGAGLACEGSPGIRKSVNCLAADFVEKSGARRLGSTGCQLAPDLSSDWPLGGLRVAEIFVEDLGNAAAIHKLEVLLHWFRP